MPVPVLGFQGLLQRKDAQVRWCRKQSTAGMRGAVCRCVQGVAGKAACEALVQVGCMQLGRCMSASVFVSRQAASGMCG